MKIVTRRRDIIWNLIGTFISMGSNFILLPFLVRGLSSDDLGIWYVFSALGSLVTLFEFGFTPTFARNVTYCWSGAQSLQREGINSESRADGSINVRLMAQLLQVCKMVYRRITLFALLFMAIPGTIYIYYVCKGSWSFRILVAWLLYMGANVVNMYYLYYAAMIRGIGGIAEDNKNKVFSRTVQLILSAALLLLGFGLIGAVIGYVAYAFFYRLYGYHLFWGNKTIKKLHINSIQVSQKEKKEVHKIVSFNAYKDGIVMLSNYGATQAGTVLCSLFLNLQQTGLYSMALQLATGVGNIAMAYLNSCRPAIQSAYQQSDMPIVQRYMGKSLIAYIVIFVAGVLGTVFVAYPFLSFIKHGQSYDSILFLGVALYMFTFNWIAFFSSILANFNTIPYVKAYVITSVSGILLSTLALAICHFGPWGLVWGMLLPQLIYNAWKWPEEAISVARTTLLELLSNGIHRWIRRK